MVTQEELEKMSPEEIAQLQKQNCVFCKIIAGQIPSNKVFEAGDVVSFLDINPSTKGHCLVMPKEHYPILPLIPPNVFQGMFKDAKFISQGIKDALLCPYITLFVANGAVAGQQAGHFLFHIVPREKGDALQNFSITPNPDLLSAQEELLSSLKNNLPLMMQNHFKRLGVSPPGTSQQQQTQGDSSTQAPAQISPQQAEEKRALVLKVLDENKDARELLRNNPDDFKKLLAQNKELEAVFAGVDLNVLSEKLKQIPEDSFSNKVQEHNEEASVQEQVQASDSQESSSTTPVPTSAAMQYANENSPTPKPVQAPQQVSSTPQAQQSSPSSQEPVKSAIFLGDDPIMQRDAILAYFEEKPQAKEIFIDDLGKFKELLSARPDIQELFKDVDLDKLSVRLKELRDKESGGEE